MITIHGLDNACEFLLRIICDHLELESKVGRSFDNVDLSSLSGAVSKALSEEYEYRLPYLADLKVLRQVRNLVQHGAIDPHGDVDRFVRISSRFFNRAVSEIFGFENGKLATSALIDDPTVKEHLERAEKFLVKNEFLEVVIASRDAFENALYQKEADSDITLSLMPSIVQAKASDSPYLWSIVTIKRELELTRHKINSDDAHRFLDYVDYVPIDRRAAGFARILQRDWNLDDAQFCYQFAGSTALQWQSAAKPPIEDLRQNAAKYKHKEQFGPIPLDDAFDGGCIYALESGTSMQLMYVPTEIREQFEELSIGNIYTFKHELFIDGESQGPGETRCKLLGHYSELGTNNPPRWKVIIWYEFADDA